MRCRRRARPPSKWDLPAFRPQQQMSCCHCQAALFGVEAIVAGSVRTGVPEGPEIGEDIDLLHASHRLADAFSASVQSIATAGKLKRSSEEVHAIAFSRQLAASTAHVKGQAAVFCSRPRSSTTCRCQPTSLPRMRRDGRLPGPLSGSRGRVVLPARSRQERRGTLAACKSYPALVLDAAKPGTAQR